MPTYQYRCTECGHDLEAVQKFSDAALTECPNCGGQLRKIFNAVGVVFKGSGFYRTDSRTGNGSSDGGSKSDSAPAEKGSGTKESKGDGGSAAPAKESSPAPAAASSSSSSSSTGTKAASS